MEALLNIDVMNRLIRERNEYRESYMEYSALYTRVLELYFEQLKKNREITREAKPPMLALGVQFFKNKE